MNRIVNRINNPNTSAPLKILSSNEINTLMKKQKEDEARDKTAAKLYSSKETRAPTLYDKADILNAIRAESNMRNAEKALEAQAALLEAQADGEAGRVSGETATTNKLHTFDHRDTSSGGTKRKNYKRKTTRRRHRR